MDDGSTDDSATIAKSFGPPVKVIRQANQGGVGRPESRHGRSTRGLGHLSGCGRSLEAEKLEKQLATADDPSIIAVHTAFFAFGSSHDVVNLAGEPPKDRYSVRRICLTGNPCMPSSLIVRRDTPARFLVWTRYAEDAIFVLDLIRLGRIALVPEPLVGYRKHRRQ